ncbi:MAG: nucleoside-diphosphate kinase [Patescibacteria group bacterium]
MSHPSKETTFVMIKPDGVQRALVGEIIKRVERVGLKIVGLKMVLPTEEQCWTHYNKDEAWFAQKGERTVADRQAAGLPADKPAVEYGKDIVRALVKFMTSGPVVAMVLSGNQAVGIVKKLVGGTEPLTSDVGTIRGDYTLDSYSLSSQDERAVRNLIHCSDKPEEAQRETQIWFKPEELVNYRQLNEEILYDVNLDGILE